MPLTWNFDNSYTRLPGALYQRQPPLPVRDPRVAVFNTTLAAELGLDPQNAGEEEIAQFASGNALPPGSDPIAQAYAGHQYGHLTMLGDGRAVLLGEQIDPNGKRWDIQLKGSGRTPFSRGGDGRAALGPMLREYLISEAMAALGIPSTRSLAVVSTGEVIQREVIQREGPQPGGVLVRTAASHIRVGTFQYAAGIGDTPALTALAGHLLERHYPEAKAASNPMLAMFEAIVQRQANLLGKWMNVGFVHGVMNTDNMALSGETIDYGPCAFLDEHSLKMVFSSIDRHGRYAYGNQPLIARWNLARFAETLLPLIDANEAAAVSKVESVLGDFLTRVETAWHGEVAMRLGLDLLGESGGEQRELVTQLLLWMERTGSDHTNTLLEILDRIKPETRAGREFRWLGVKSDGEFENWLAKWRGFVCGPDFKEDEVRKRLEPMNPAVIPRNHLVQEALNFAVDGNIAPFFELLTVLQHPFQHRQRVGKWHSPPAGSAPCVTYCGT